MNQVLKTIIMAAIYMISIFLLSFGDYKIRLYFSYSIIYRYHVIISQGLVCLRQIVIITLLYFIAVE